MGTKRCCCGPGCVGCCLPYNDPDESCSPPGRRVKILAWTISAPYCPAPGGIDGLSGQFSPETTCPHDETGPCGNCLCMLNTDHSLGFLIGTAYYEETDNDANCDPPGSPLPCCAATPCGGLGFCFNLMCNHREPLQDGELIDNCCGRLKLLVLINGADAIIGGDPVNLTDNVCLENLSGDIEPNFAGCPGNSGSVLVQLDSVECYCDDEAQAFSVTFDLSVLQFSCAGGNGTGTCSDKPACCLPSNCSLQGATLTVVLGE